LNFIEIVSKLIFFNFSLFLKIFEMILKDEGLIQATGKCTGKLVSLNCAFSSVCRVLALFVSSLTFCVPELLLV